MKFFVRRTLIMLLMLLLGGLAGRRAKRRVNRSRSTRSRRRPVKVRSSGRRRSKRSAPSKLTSTRTAASTAVRSRSSLKIDQTNPQVAVQIMNQFLAKNPAIVVGGLFNATCYAVAALLKGDGPVLYCYAPGVKLTSWMYTTGYSVPATVAAGLRYFRERGWTKITILTMNDANGQDTERAIGEVLARPEYQGITVTTREHMALGDISIAAQIEHIKNLRCPSDDRLGCRHDVPDLPAQLP